MSNYQLNNGALCITVSSHGAELRSVVSNGQEYMWEGDERYWGRVSPVLFPFVGGCNQKTYRTKGKEFQIGQHGFARDMEFDLEKQTDDSLTFVLKSDASTLEKYPYAFVLKVSYQIKENNLTVSWHVENPNDETMYFSIGGHPAFVCPPDKTQSQSDCYLHFDSDSITYEKINGNGLLVPGKYVLPLEDQSYRIKENTFDDDALIVQGGQAHKVSLLTPDKKPYVTVTFDAPLFGLWSPAKKNAPFVCIEPWYGRCDKDAYNGELKGRDYEQTLEAGKSFDTSYQVTFDAI